MNKHKAVKHEYRGMKFDSGRELKRWKSLKSWKLRENQVPASASAVCAGKVGCPEPSP